MELRPIRIDASDPARPRVEVAGIDATDCVDRAVLIIEPGVLPRLVLELSGVDVLAEGLANVVSVDASGLPSIRDWLTQLDAGQLERDALELIGSFADDTEVETTGQAFIAALLKLAP